MSTSNDLLKRRLPALFATVSALAMASTAVHAAPRPQPGAPTAPRTTSAPAPATTSQVVTPPAPVSPR